MPQSFPANPSDLVHLRWLSDAGLRHFGGKKILDLGCGSGHLCALAASERAATVVGIDLVEPAAKASWQFLKMDLDSPSWSDQLAFTGPFDLILAFDIIEHMASPFQFLRGCRKILNPAGTLVVTTPNLTSWERWVKPDSWSGVTDPQHKILFSRYSLRFLAGKVDLSPRIIKAPMKSLAWMGALQPHIGGQIFCILSPI